ncbi:alpha-2-macroglobulin family protein [Flavobacterium sp. '19STA2R22 D10 B1']|uniref:alpha-2-macroglobulin family protein n=1 Tax=Flavobacterium aerium TaxID=3037261 RepID=UPI00278BFCD7|nr:MG2 domain-containing protein [Flavobacterium sp. '19STA2R22 D10 B1']
MKSRKLALLLITLLIIQSCNKRKSAQEFNSDFSLYKEYIANFTSGLLSSESDIRVVLAYEKGDWKPNQELDKSLFTIDPSIDGKVVALSNNTIAFQPKKPLKQDTEYHVTLHLGKLIKTKSELSKFNFTVKTLKQDFLVETQDLQSYNKQWQYLNTTLKTNDNMDLATAKKLLTVEQNGKKLNLKFDQNLNSKTEFKFVIDSIQRLTSDSTLKISWDGKPFDIDEKGSMDFEIPGQNNFKIIKVDVIDNGEQVVWINFSDPLKKEQDLKGLVAVETATNLRYITDGNVLKVFFEKPLAGELLVEIFQGIENIDGGKLKETYAEKKLFEQIKPSIRFVKNGTILPSSSNLKVNFEAANLKAVDVKIYKIFQNNILQFLQDNSINGNYNLRRVALPVAKKTLQLTENRMSDYSKWNAYALDIASLIKPEPGAIYRIEFSFKKSYSLFKCDTTDTTEETNNVEEETDEVVDDENYDDDYYGEDEYRYYSDYDWRQEDNPCNNSYYYNKKIATNILATDLGVIAKKGENNSYFFAVNDIVTTEPVADANIDIYNYQQQKLASFTTNKDGIATFDLDKKAFFAVVTKGVNSTYIKLDEGLSQSLSNFDVAGNELQKGLKGYMYGERGVWRPGDTLYISFILNDIASKLPTSHPIKFRLSDPRGKVVYQTVQNYTPQNHYKFAFATNQDAPTGNWEAVVSVGGAQFYKNIKIETIKPNRLKIKNNLSTTVLSASKPNTGNIEVTWLHGAIAKDLKIEVQAKFSQQVTTFKGFDKYVFDDPSRKFNTEEINIFSGKVDDHGKATITVQPKLTGQAPGMLKASFITKVYENGGDFSTDVIGTSYSPYQTYVGIKSQEPNKYGMLETGKINRFDIVTVDENGRPKSVKNLEVKVYKVDWRWWWDATNDNLSNYNASSTNVAVHTYKVDTDQNGKANVQFKVEDDLWGRYLIRVADLTGGHAAGQTVLIDWPIWSGKTKNTDAATANMLVFSTDKKKYDVGEKATISFPSSVGGRALVSIENGSQVLESLWVTTKKGETQVEVPITAKMAPNVYFYITLLQPHASTLNDSPIRMYGILPIEVEDKNTILSPVITMPDVLRPEQTVNINVKEKTGKAMTYTIAIVDDGLLDLTRFKTPNAWNEFYSREALGVRTWDIYDDVIGAYGGKVNQIFSIGGDEDLGGGQAKKANRFKPMVVYLGPFSLDKNQNKTHKIKIPKYVGSVRTMVVAGNAKTSAYGNAEKTTPVRNPLMVLASLPRKISPSEKVTLPITVFAMEKQVKNVSIQLKTSKGLKIVGSAMQNLTFPQPDEQMAYYELEVGNLTGIAKVEVIATSGKEKASYEVEIDVINPNPVTQLYKDVVLEPNASQTITWETFGVSGSNKARLEVSSFPSIDFNKRLDYLIQYPHGCLEQVTSGVFPQLYIADIADIDAKRKQDIQRNVTEGIKKLSGYQISSGGFAYWPGNPIADDWATSYAGHFLLEAEKKGYVLPINFKNSWLALQKKAAKEWRFFPKYGNDLAQAYRLYTLALAAAPDLSSMNRLRETAGISNEAKLRLAVAYALAGQKKAGIALLNTSKIDPENSNYSYYYYGSSERNRAMILETLLLLDQKATAFTMANKVAKDLSDNRWMSTQTTAYCLYSMSKFAKLNGGQGIDIQYTSNEKKQLVQTSKAFADRKLDIKQGQNSITITNNKKNTIYVKVLNSGILPVGQEQAVQNNINATIQFKDRKGNTINVKSLVQGTEFVTEVTIQNTSLEYVANVALTQILPSGWEIVNTRFTDYGDSSDSNADYIDIRDDRTNFYFGLKSNEKRVFKILLNASYLGSYYLPGVQCEAMYDNSYIARTKGEWVSVIKE